MSSKEEDDAQEKFFNELLEARVVWSGHARITIVRALADIRSYHFDPERASLLPSKRKCVAIESIDTKELVIEKIERVEDEFEEIEEA